jgi:hypothetical protein
LKAIATVISIFVLVACARAQEQTFSVTGILSGRAVRATGQPSWLQGGFGRLDYGGSAVDQSRTVSQGVGQLGVDWRPSRYFDVHADGLVRTQPTGYGGKAGGLVQAYADVKFPIGSTDEIQLRGGQFFLPTSRENRGDLWSSPYTISFSAINNWIGQEVRPAGLDLQWKRGFYLTFGATAFRNNDTMGTLLAWRGWSVGNRLTVYDEVLPLPPISSLTKTDFFGLQRPDGTKPFGNDLDGRTGFSGRIRFQVPERGLIQITHLDNRGDHLRHVGEYAWATRYNQVSAELGNPEGSILISEWMSGETAMGRLDRAHVYVDFHSAYVLISHKVGRARFSIRGDTFTTEDLAHAAADAFGEHGHAWTAAWLYELTPAIRTALELTRIAGNRQAAADSGFNPNANGRTVTAEVRYKF